MSKVNLKINENFFFYDCDCSIYVGDHFSII